MAIAVLFPGFTRPPSATDSLRVALAKVGMESIAPNLSRRWWPIDYMSSRRHSRVADELVDWNPGRSFVLVGHSAGAAAATGVAGYLAARVEGRVKGMVFIDGVDSPRATIRHALAGEIPPLIALCGAPSPCNRHGALCRLLGQYPPRDVQLVDCSWMSHGAIEPPGTRVYERACQSVVNEGEHQRALEVAVAAICSLA